MATAVNEVTRGEEAEYLLNHEIIKEAFGKTRDALYSAMNRSAMGDEKTHNHLVISLQLLNQIERHIKEVATTGRLAKLEIERANGFTRLRKAVGF